MAARLQSAAERRRRTRGTRPDRTITRQRSKQPSQADLSRPRMNISLEARAKIEDRSVVHETGGLILRDDVSECSVQQHLVCWRGRRRCETKTCKVRVDLAMNPDGGGFAGWAICKVQGPLQQNKLAAAGRARTSVAPGLWDGLTWPAQWWGHPHYLRWTTWGPVSNSKTRIAWRAARTIRGRRQVQER